MTKETANGPNFILGVGAQKAGTTWLFRYLNEHPDCAMGPVKEMCFFSDPRIAVHSKFPMPRSYKSLLQAAKILNNKGTLGTKASERVLGLLDAAASRLQPERYAEYYQRIVATNPSAKLIGDITPGYSGLHPDDVFGMKEYLVKMGYSVKVVFLMRDPVTRCFSAARMTDRNILAGKRKKDMDWSGDNFASFAIKTGSEVRTRYEKTIAALETHFDSGQIFYGIYEDFFNVTEIEKLCTFLGISFVEPPLEVRVNAGKEEQSLPEAQAAEVRAFYADTYAFCRDRFGAERIDKLWSV